MHTSVHTKRIVALILIVVFLVPASFFGVAHRADAQLEAALGGAAGCAAAVGISRGLSKVNFLSSLTTVPTNPEQLTIKEQILDCLVNVVAQQLIEEMSNNIVEWIQSGFDGNPAFVTDLNQFYTDVGDQIAGDFIDTELEFLCSPFRNEIQIALTRAYQNDPQDHLACSLSDIVGNIDAFIDGDFSQGGWQGWFQLTQVPQNNPYGAFIIAQNELANRIATAQQIEREKLQFGEGFLSYERCADGSSPYDLDEGGAEFFGRACQDGSSPQTATPGAVIQTQLNEQLGSGRRKLEVADEINEIITALIAYLVQDVLTGDGGLAGYNSADFSHDLPDIEIPDLPGTLPTQPNDTEPAGPIGQTACFVANGNFFTPSPGSEVARFRFPLPQNTSYNSITVDMDVFHGGWSETGANNARHNIFWLARDGNRNLFGYVNARAPSANNVFFSHGIGQAHDFKTRIQRNRSLSPGSTYHFNYVYDIVANGITLRITSGGNTVATLTSTPDVPGINVGNQIFLMDIGFPTGNQNEPPTYGWRYQNLNVTFNGNGSAGNCQSATPVIGSTPGGAPSGGVDSPDGSEESIEDVNDFN